MHVITLTGFLAGTSFQRAFADALANSFRNWGTTFDQTALFQFGVFGVPLATLTGEGLVEDLGVLTSGTITGGGLSIDGTRISEVQLSGRVEYTLMQDWRELAEGDPLNPDDDDLRAITRPLFDDDNIRVDGSAFDDVIEGGRKKDTILGRDGDDTVVATRGNDVVKLGGGRDTYLLEDLGQRAEKVFVDLDTGRVVIFDPGAPNGRIVQSISGAEVLAGTKRPDNLNGDGFRNEIYGLAGDDVISGEGGDDLLFGEAGDDLLEGGLGRDDLFGGAGNDIIVGAPEGDTSGARERLFGGNGDDRLFGGTGDDTMFGGNGDDLLDGDTGADVLTGGAGADTFRFANSYDARIADFDIDDRIRLSSEFASAVAIGQVGPDTVITARRGAVLLEGIDASVLEVEEVGFNVLITF